MRGGSGGCDFPREIDIPRAESRAECCFSFCTGGARASPKRKRGGEGGDPQCALHADLLRPIMQRRTTTRRLCRLSAGRAAAHGFRPFRDFVNRPPNGREDRGTNRARGKVNRVRSDSRGRVQRSRRRACGRLFSSRGARSRDRIVEISRSLGSRLTRVGLAAASSARGGGGEGWGGRASSRRLRFDLALGCPLDAACGDSAFDSIASSEASPRRAVPRISVSVRFQLYSA